MRLERIFGSCSQAHTHPAAKRRLRPGVLILLVLLFVQGQYVQATGEVLWAVISSWDDSRTDDDYSITPPSAVDIDQARGRPIPTRLGLHGRLKPSDMPGSDQSPHFSDLITRAPPAASSR